MAKKEVKKIRATNTLAQKVGSGEIETAKVDAAQSVIENTQVDFAEVAKPFLDQLGKAINAARTSTAGALPEDLASSINFSIMNLKANATTFNYPAISEVAGTVMNFLDAVKTVDGEIITIADNLHKAITVIIMRKMSGKDAPGSKELLQEFRDVCKRYMDKRIGGA